jgi:putative membrane protein
MTYLLVKSLHIIAVIAWMAAMLYLPRLFVYHAEATDNAVKNTLTVMERRLLRYICTPAMIASWAFGLTMVAMNPALFQSGWVHAKFLLVILMSGLHGFYAASRKKFESGANTRSPKFWRVMNEAPTVLLIAIVMLAVMKPF